MSAQILEGTWEEILHHADELTGKRIKVYILGTDEVAENGLDERKGESQPQNLAEYLNGYIGALQADGPNPSSEVGESFDRIMVEKYRKQGYQI
jgi:hypothetical protein